MDRLKGGSSYFNDNKVRLALQRPGQDANLSSSGNSYAQAGVVLPNTNSFSSFYPPISDLPSSSTVDAQDFFPGAVEEDAVHDDYRKKKFRPSKGRLPIWGGAKSAKEDIGEVEMEDSTRFRTASQKLAADAKRNQSLHRDMTSSLFHKPRGKDGKPNQVLNNGRNVRSSFVPPVRSGGPASGGGMMARHSSSKDSELDESTLKCLQKLMNDNGELPESLRNIEPRLIQHVCNEIMTRDTKIKWDDIAGLEDAKECLQEMVIWPLKRPELFRGTRAPGTGLLLYGPPGTGKTLIGKAIAGECNATFFSISASSLTSKWIGEGEKLVRALFGVARSFQPAVIFVDEIDSLLSQRKSEGEHESSRRLKTQFLVEMEGCGDSLSQQLLVVGATNRPQELDEAVRRRMSKRLYIPLPEHKSRALIVRNLLANDGLLDLALEEVEEIASKTEGYSGSDMANLVREASMAPLRDAIKAGVIDEVKPEDIRPVVLQDFLNALHHVRPSVAPEELEAYGAWTKQFGSNEKR